MAGWLVGATVRVEIVITDPDDHDLVDPASFTLVSLVRDTTSIDITGITPERTGLGTYKILFHTTGYQPGTYSWLVRATHSDGSVALCKDSFVLTAV